MSNDSADRNPTGCIVPKGSMPCVDACPADAQEQIRAQFVNVIQAVFSQQLLPLADGQGRVVATETMIANYAIKNLIAEQKTNQINSAIQSGRAQGMKTMNDDLASLVRRGLIERADALAVSPDPVSLSKAL